MCVVRANHLIQTSHKKFKFRNVVEWTSVICSVVKLFFVKVVVIPVAIVCGGSHCCKTLKTVETFDKTFVTAGFKVFFVVFVACVVVFVVVFSETAEAAT